jgi:hypothetical protein
VGVGGVVSAEGNGIGDLEHFEMRDSAGRVFEGATRESAREMGESLACGRRERNDNRVALYG